MLDADFRKKVNIKSNAAQENFPYESEWQKMCEEKIETISMWAHQGYLASSRFRSLCWMRFLGIVSDHFTKWLSDLRSRRQGYEQTKYNLMTVPFCENSTINLAINNPLSQDQDSPWYKHFEQMELKTEIRTDVDRTMPDNEFFQRKKIQDMMVTILFCYARKYMYFSYIQGMHEILAILIHALNTDRETYKKNVQLSGEISTLQEIMDDQYLEHDSFLLFEAVMSGLQPWYERTNDTKAPPKVPIIYGKPIPGCECVGPTAKAVNKLHHIHDQLLCQLDPEVYNQLKKLEVIPQVYGIRWTRLMFGREFSLQSVLTLWDAIFCDRSLTFSLIDYIIVAMLIHIREDILAADFTQVINILMRYPPTTDARAIVKMAVQFRTKATEDKAERIKASNLPKVKEIAKSPREFARSTSVPRRPESFSGSKQRSTSVEHRAVGLTRVQSPTVETHLTSVTFSKPHAVTNGENSTNGKKIVGPRFSGMFARQRETQSGCLAKPMEELSVVKKSLPISAVKEPIVSSDSDLDAEHIPRVINKMRSSSEELLVVNRNCTQRLKGVEQTLATRLDQLHLQSDLPLRAVMESIREVIESLEDISIRRRSAGSRGIGKSVPA